RANKNFGEKFMQRVAVLRATKRAMVVLAFILAVTIGQLAISADAIAGTPLSNPKSCNYSGGAACPNTAADVSNWPYTGYGYNVPGQQFNSLSELVTGVTSLMTTPPTGMDCTWNYSNYTDLAQYTYSYGIEVSDNLQLNASITYYNGSGYG